MQSFGHTGLSGRRALIGSEILDLSVRHGLASYRDPRPPHRVAVRVRRRRLRRGRWARHAPRRPRRTPRPPADDRLHDLVPRAAPGRGSGRRFHREAGRLPHRFPAPRRGGDAGLEPGPAGAGVTVPAPSPRPLARTHGFRPLRTLGPPGAAAGRRPRGGARPAPRPAGRGHVGAAGPGPPGGGETRSRCAGRGGSTGSRAGELAGAASGLLSLGPVGPGLG